MNWFNSQKCQLPKDGQEVYIMVDGINYTAIFNKTENVFIVKNLKNISFNADIKAVFWAEKDSDKNSS